MSEEGFLSRWSRRKRAAEAGRPAEEPVAAEAAPADPVFPFHSCMGMDACASTA